MKKIYLFLIIIFYCTISIAQDTICPPLRPPPPPEPEIEEEKKFKVIEEMSRYPGCEENATVRCAEAKIEDFIYRNLVHPKEGIAKKIEGIVVMQCVLNREGQIEDVRILKDIGGGCGASVLEAVLKIPTLKPTENVWKPVSARDNGIRVQLNIPIRFQL